MAATIASEGKTFLLNELRTEIANLKIALIQNADQLVPNSERGDIDETGYSGYARGNVAWGVVSYNMVTGKAEMTAAAMTFNHNGGPLFATVNGYALIDIAGGGTLIGFEEFPAKTMAAVGDSLTVTPKLTLTQG